MKYWILLFFSFFSLASFAQDEVLIHSVLSQLKLESSIVKENLIVAKDCPNNPQETIVFIPIIQKEDEDHFVLQSYVLIVNKESGKIINRYFDHNYLVSDAIVLSEIVIDTALYKISESQRAFGISVHHYSRSQPNPYSHTRLSLFVKSADRLKKILNNFTVLDYSGEWDTSCAGEFVRDQKTLMVKADKTNNYFDILVKNKITEIKSFVDTNGECEEREEISTTKTLLKFNGEDYRVNGVFPSLDVYLTDTDVTGTNLRKEPNGKIIKKLMAGDDYYMLTITEAKNGWFKLEEVSGIEDPDIVLPEETVWIHHSVVGAATRKEVTLLDTPEHGAVVGTIKKETGVQIKDKYLDWVQIEYEGLLGWIESEWLCGNPVTTCP